jgi:hypothetical protein
MGRHYAIVKIRGDFRPVIEVDADDYLPLGGLEDVRKAIRTAFPSAEWSKSTPTYAAYSGHDANGNEFGIEIDLQGVESANCVLMTVSGSGDAFLSLLKLTEANGWLAIDMSGGKFLDPNNPEVA